MYIQLTHTCIQIEGITVFLEPTNLTLYEDEGDAVISIQKVEVSDLTTSVFVSTKDLSTSGMC